MNRKSMLFLALLLSGVFALAQQDTCCLPGEFITEECLVKFGFEPHGPDYLICAGTKYYSLETLADIWTWHHATDMIYIYQLREAYRGLTGKELTQR